MKKLILAALLALAACTDESDTRRTLTASGFTNITTTGWAGPFVCGKDDTYETGFVATNPAGARVSGVVCCGVFKGCTIRF